MSAVKLARPRIIRSPSGPLTRAQIEPVAPAVYSNGPHASRSNQYAYVPTFEVLQTLIDNGFGVYEAAQQRSKKEDKDPYTKHMLRLRHVDRWSVPDKHYGGVPEMVMVNAHDGTASYHLFAGFFRFICTNGMVAGKHVTHFRIRHTIPEVTRAEVLTGGMEIVTKEFAELMQRIDRMAKVTLDERAQVRLARDALRLRYGSVNAPFTEEHLLLRRRSEDKGNDVWTTFNVIQENLTQGGFEVRSTMYNRRSMVRPVERVSNVLKINQGLWDLAEACVPA